MPFPTKSMTECTEDFIKSGYFKMEEVTERGRTLPVFINQPQSLRAYWERAQERFANNEYIVYENERYTYADMDKLVMQYVTILKGLNAKKGDHIALLARNSPQWIAVFWAIHYIGAVTVNVNAWLAEDVLEYCVKKAQSTLLFVDVERAIKLESRAGALPKTVIVIGAKYHANLSVPRVAKYVNADELLAKTQPAAPFSVSIIPTDPATIFFTSGTTSLPKAVYSTQRQVGHCPFSNAVGTLRQFIRRGDPFPVPFTADHLVLVEPKTFLLTVPLFHVTGCQSVFLSTTFTGGKIVLVYKWDAPKMAELIIKEKVHNAGGVPFMAAELIESKLVDHPEDLVLENLTYGGAPPSLRLAEVIKKKLPNVSPTQGWGLTETNATATSFSAEDYLARPNSCGFPTPGVSIKIISVDSPLDAPHLGTNVTGEIVTKGLQNAMGYFDAEKATAEAFSPDGWFRTGDVGHVDEEGFLFISDRAKDIIIRGGENIASVTVEAAISSDLRVREVAVLSVPDETLGELVSAVVVPWPGKNITEQEVKDVVAQRMPKHCVPACVVVRDATRVLDRNANGKIVKRDITDTREKWAKITQTKAKL